MKLASQEGLAPGKDLSEKLDNLAEYGYEGIEFGGNGIQNRQDEIIKATQNHQVKPSTICAGYGGCLVDGDKSERDRAMSDIKDLLNVAGNIGAVGLIMVPVFGDLRINDLSPYKSARQLTEELLVALLKDLGDYAGEVGSIVLIEPLNRYETRFINRLEQGVDICKRVNKPNVQIMADFFHMSIEESNIAKSIKAAGSYIKHVHLADSTRLLPGYGHTDFKSGFAALKEIGFENYMALECGVPGPGEVELPKSANYMKQWL
ncbi:MAG: TIM barrel protein [Candidatus Poribacteria bacterium]